MQVDVVERIAEFLKPDKRKKSPSAFLNEQCGEFWIEGGIYKLPVAEKDPKNPDGDPVVRSVRVAFVSIYQGYEPKDWSKVPKLPKIGPRLHKPREKPRPEQLRLRLVVFFDKIPECCNVTISKEEIEKEGIKDKDVAAVLKKKKKLVRKLLRDVFNNPQEPLGDMFKDPAVPEAWREGKDVYLDGVATAGGKTATLTAIAMEEIKRARIKSICFDENTTKFLLMKEIAVCFAQAGLQDSSIDRLVLASKEDARESAVEWMTFHDLVSQFVDPERPQSFPSYYRDRQVAHEGSGQLGDGWREWDYSGASEICVKEAVNFFTRKYQFPISLRTAYNWLRKIGLDPGSDSQGYVRLTAAHLEAIEKGPLNNYRIRQVKTLIAKVTGRSRESVRKAVNRRLAKGIPIEDIVREFLPETRPED